MVGKERVAVGLGCEGGEGARCQLGTAKGGVEAPERTRGMSEVMAAVHSTQRGWVTLALQRPSSSSYSLHTPERPRLRKGKELAMGTSLLGRGT